MENQAIVIIIIAVGETRSAARAHNESIVTAIIFGYPEIYASQRY
jgi:hypothetical protein